MSAAELREKLDWMLRKAPIPEKIACIRATREYKDALEKAKKAKSLEKLQSAYNQLRTYYGI